jgi:hypothetical protein
MLGVVMLNVIILIAVMLSVSVPPTQFSDALTRVSIFVGFAPAKYNYVQ